MDPRLRSKLTKYQHKDLCLQDVARTLHQYNNLVPDLQKFTHNDGRQVDLLALNGTLPVPIRGVTYNIPVCVWLQENHPYVPPIVFVRPTGTMAIKASQHVDTNGKVYHTFLHEWSYPRSDLSALLQILCSVFSTQPPVYTRQPMAPPQPTEYNRPQQPGYPGASLSYPVGGAARMPMPGYPSSTRPNLEATKNSISPSKHLDKNIIKMSLESAADGNPSSETSIGSQRHKLRNTNPFVSNPVEVTNPPATTGLKQDSTSQLKTSIGQDDTTKEQIINEDTSAQEKPVEEDTPTFYELGELSELIGEKWKTLGRRLKISEPNLTLLEREYGNQSERVYQMLLHWKAMEGSAATYRVLCGALCNKMVN